MIEGGSSKGGGGVAKGTMEDMVARVRKRVYVKGTSMFTWNRVTRDKYVYMGQGYKGQV